MRYVGIGLVHGYRFTLGRFVPAGTCKYHPSCSQYALDAFRAHGLVKRLAEGRLAAASLQPVESRRLRPGMSLPLFFRF